MMPRGERKERMVRGEEQGWNGLWMEGDRLQGREMVRSRICEERGWKRREGVKRKYKRKRKNKIKRKRRS